MSRSKRQEVPEDAPVYELFPRKADTEEQAREIEEWQEKQRRTWDDHLKALRRERDRRMDRVVKALLGIGTGIVVLMVIGLAIWGIHHLVRGDQTEYYNQFSTWAGQCQKAGGHVVGRYESVATQTCVFPSGAELPRNFGGSNGGG